MVRLPAWVFKLEMIMVRCCDCGLLATRGDGTDEPSEATPETRENGTLNIVKNTSGWFSFSPLARFFCFAGSPSFPPQPPDGPGEHRSTTLVRQVNTEIECDRRRRYLPGRTPQRIEEMSLLEQVKLEYAEQREAERRHEQRWRQQVEALAESRHQESRRDHRTSLIVAAIVGLIAALIGGLISRQW